MLRVRFPLSVLEFQNIMNKKKLKGIDRIHGYTLKSVTVVEKPFAWLRKCIYEDANRRQIEVSSLHTDNGLMFGKLITFNQPYITEEGKVKERRGFYIKQYFTPAFMNYIIQCIRKATDDEMKIATAYMNIMNMFAMEMTDKSFYECIYDIACYVGNVSKKGKAVVDKIQKWLVKKNANKPNIDKRNSNKYTYYFS